MALCLRPPGLWEVRSLMTEGKGALTSSAWSAVYPQRQGPPKMIHASEFQTEWPLAGPQSEAQGVQLDSQDRTKARAFPSVRKNHNQPQGVPSPSSRAESLGLTTFSRRTV